MQRHIVKDRKILFTDGKVKLEEKVKSGTPVRFHATIKCPCPWLQSIVLREMTLKAGKTIIPYSGDVPAGFELQVTATQEPLPSIGNLTICTNDYSDPRDPFRYIGKVEVPLICTLDGARKFVSWANVDRGGGHAMVYCDQYRVLDDDSKWVKIMPNSGRNHKDAFIKIECDAEDIPSFEKYNKLRFRDTYSGV